MGKVEDLRAERKRLEERIGAIERVLEEYDAWERRAASLFPAKDEVPPESERSVEAKDEVVTNARKPTPMPEFTAAVFDVLTTAEHPMVRTQVLEALEARGIVVGGAEARNTLSARLNRMEGITKITGRGFWRKDRPYDDANRTLNVDASNEGEDGEAPSRLNLLGDL